MTRYRLSPAAQKDLEHIFDYTVQQWGLEQAVHYARLIESGCEALAGGEIPTQNCDHVRAGYRRCLVGRHAVYFLTQDNDIAVMRILHQRMDPFRHL